MKIKLDENLPTALVDKLSALGHDVDTVTAENLTGQPDPIVWQAAQREQRFFITQDLDYPRSRFLRYPAISAGYSLGPPARQVGDAGTDCVVQANLSVVCN